MGEKRHNFVMLMLCYPEKTCSELVMEWYNYLVIFCISSFASAYTFCRTYGEDWIGNTLSPVCSRSNWHPAPLFSLNISVLQLIYSQAKQTQTKRNNKLWHKCTCLDKPLSYWSVLCLGTRRFVSESYLLLCFKQVIF